MNAVLGGTIVVGTIFIGLNLLSDLLYRLLDPRTRAAMSSWPARLADERAPGVAPAGRAGPRLRRLAQLCAQPAGDAGLAIVLALVPWRCLADGWRRIRPRKGDLRTRGCCRRRRALVRHRRPGPRHPLALIHGSRITLFVVVLVAVLAAPVGLLVGTVAGYAGGWLDAVLMRITDIFLAFPKLILALAFVAALGPGIENAVIAIAITSWPPYARIARAETLTMRQADYIAPCG
jgi:ABC-type Fe3+ transport system permease subunit